MALRSLIIIYLSIPSCGHGIKVKRENNEYETIKHSNKLELFLLRLTEEFFNNFIFRFCIGRIPEGNVQKV